MQLSQRTPYSCYKLYIALKLHFTQGYDFTKYKGQVKSNYEKFKKRGDFYYFEKISKRPKPFAYILANLIDDPTQHVSDFSEKTYKRYLTVKDSMLYYFSSDIVQFDIIPKNLYNMTGPNLYYSNKIQIETLVILHKLFNICSRWDLDNPLLQSLYMIIEGYGKLINIEQDEFKNAIRKQVINGNLRKER